MGKQRRIVIEKTAHTSEGRAGNNMAKIRKTEHSGDKGSQRKNGFWGKSEEAKRLGRKQRRIRDKIKIREEVSTFVPADTGQFLKNG